MGNGTVRAHWLGVGLLGTGLLYATAASAAMQYVSDQLSINLRSGPGAKYRIERQLDAGARLQMLGRPTNGWTQVRSAAGQTGYVLTRFVSDQPAERDRGAQNKKLKSRLADIRETSADAIRIGKENEKYRKQLMNLRSDVDRLKHENQALRSHRGGMTIGALILFAGIVLGLMLPMFRRRRKDSWDSL